MTKQEFRDFCHDEFVKRGFEKRRTKYYISSRNLESPDKDSPVG